LKDCDSPPYKGEKKKELFGSIFLLKNLIPPPLKIDVVERRCLVDFKRTLMLMKDDAL